MTVCSYRPQIDKNREIPYNTGDEAAMAVITIHDTVHALVGRSPTNGSRRSPAREGLQRPAGAVLRKVIINREGGIPPFLVCADMIGGSS